jgi:hypothetical protein
MYAYWQSYQTAIYYTLHASGTHNDEYPWRTWLTGCSAKKLNKGQEVMFEAKLTNASQTVRTYVMCDAVGTLAWPFIFGLGCY